MTRTDCTADIQQKLDNHEQVELSVYDGCEVGVVSFDALHHAYMKASSPCTLYLKHVPLSKGMFDLKQNKDTAERLDYLIVSGRNNLTIECDQQDRHVFQQALYDHDTHEVPGIRLNDWSGVTFKNLGSAFGVRVMKCRKSVVSGCHAEDLWGGGIHAITDSLNESIQDILTTNCTFKNVKYPTASSIGGYLLGTSKRIPPRIYNEHLHAVDVFGRWKTHAHNYVEMRNVYCRRKSVVDKSWGGYNLPPDVPNAGVYLKDCHFDGYDSGVMTDAGSLYDRSHVVLEDITASNGNYLCANSNRLPVYAFGEMHGHNLRESIFGYPDFIRGNWTEERSYSIQM